MSPASKETIQSVIEQKRPTLEKILEGCEHLLRDYKQKIPDFVITANRIVTKTDYVEKFDSASSGYKCQRAWLTGVTTFAGRLKRILSSDPELVERATAYEQMIRERSMIPVEKDPHQFTDFTGRIHRLTTEEEINRADEFLTFAIEKLKSLLK